MIAKFIVRGVHTYLLDGVERKVNVYLCEIPFNANYFWSPIPEDAATFTHESEIANALLLVHGNAVIVPSYESIMKSVCMVPSELELLQEENTKLRARLEMFKIGYEAYRDLLVEYASGRIGPKEMYDTANRLLNL